MLALAHSISPLKIIKTQKLYIKQTEIIMIAKLSLPNFTYCQS